MNDELYIWKYSIYYKEYQEFDKLFEIVRTLAEDKIYVFRKNKTVTPYRG